MKPRRLLLPALVLALTASAARTSSAVPALQLSFTRVGANCWFVDWDVIAPHRTFFLLAGSSLEEWRYLPIMTFGSGPQHFGVTCEGDPRFFLRVVSEDKAWINSLQEAREADFDGDGISNWIEIELAFSDPLDKDSTGEDRDGDGIPDWWENMYGLDPEDPNDAALDYVGNGPGDGVTNLEKYQIGRDPRVAVLNDSSATLGLKVFTPME